MTETLHTDVVILGGGLAGLTLARQLLMYTDKRVVIVERYLPDEHGRGRQKYGESTVQLSGWYFGKVLDLTEVLLQEHYIKYNLRFYWPPRPGVPAGMSASVVGRDPGRCEDYSQSYLSTFSNIATFQLDRNEMERAVRERNEADPRFTLIAPARELHIDLDPHGEHRVSFLGVDGPRTVAAPWLVDASGRNRVLARKLGIAQPSPIKHGSSFAWVDGLVDVEKLTDRSLREQRLGRWHHQTGNAPQWLATNHFCDDGLWFWVIPLQGKTSLGLVYEHGAVDFADVNTGEKLLAWACERFPCFAHDLPKRKLLGHYGLRDFAHDCRTCISEERWAMTGEAGRFSDPLYSPGSDLIAIHNTLIVDAIKHDHRSRCRQHETIARALYDGYVPGYANGYLALGDQEAFTLKYVWELAVYFVAYVFPFAGELFTEPDFVRPFLQRFSRLGPWNRGLQDLFSGLTRWKRANGTAGGGANGEQVLFEFSKFDPLARSRTLLEKVGLAPAEAIATLDPHFADLEELARFIAAHVTSRVAGAPPEAVYNRAFVESIDLEALRFDPEQMRQRWEAAQGCLDPYEWNLDANVMGRFWPRDGEMPMEGDGMPRALAAGSSLGMPGAPA